MKGLAYEYEEALFTDVVGELQFHDINHKEKKMNKNYWRVDNRSLAAVRLTTASSQ